LRHCAGECGPGRAALVAEYGAQILRETSKGNRMIRSKLGYLLFAVMLCGSFIPAHADTVFTDTTFNLTNYSTTVFTSTGATAAASQCPTCGNPGSALEIDMSFPTGNSAADLGVVNNTFSYDPLTQGAITSISASVDKDLTLNSSSGGGDTFHPMIEQDGNYYIAAIAGVGLSGPGTTGYETLSETGLLATSFTQYFFATGTTGTANPNFDGDPMLFGLAQISGSNGTALLTADYDNLSLDLVTPAAAPEPSSLLLLGAGLAGLLFISRRKLALNN
jgi:hypothetical protein